MQHAKTVEQVIDFLAAVTTLSKEHGLSISHEDAQGAFLIEEYDERYTEWLQDADYGIYSYNLPQNKE